MSAIPSARLLDALQAEGILDDAACEAIAGDAPMPWWLAVVQGFAAWVASLIILSSFFGPLLMAGNGPVTRAVGGVVLLAAAFLLFRRRRTFTDQMALAFSFAGQALLVSSVADRFLYMVQGTDTLARTALVVAAAMAAIPSTTLHRTACVLTVLASIGYLIGPGDGLAVFGLALAVVALALWLSRARWAPHPQAPLFKAAGHATTLAALCVAVYGSDTSGTPLLGELLRDRHLSFVLPIYRVGAAALFTGTVFWLSRDAGRLRVPLAVAGLLFAVVAHPAPGLLVSAAVLLAAFHASHRGWTVMALAFAALYLGEYHYSLHSTLLIKSAVIAASGVVLLAARAALLALSRSPR
ncbi:MAG TPA: DUF4401 domain-containing protein [Aromatoleum sp.]|uniref:DUF4401 domain-containing protein n=1 Tax=Aromatoleum sp. TaxID=2307007 RepID=UPI002B48B7C6|nr:DUF4401 domain-containing protein [Aromatoleum sp.]HJV25509.1 DUF4401 domain-containing protein [Aromatoleum sp.]